MNSLFRHISALFILFLWMGWTHIPSAAAQETRVIGIQADDFKARQIEGRTVFDLVRPVLTQEQSVLSSDFGLDEGNGYVRFWGHVQIVEEGDTLRAANVRYNRNTKIGIAEGEVYMTDGVARLRAPYAVHYSDEDKTEFDQGVAYSDSMGTLSSKSAVYYTEPNVARFFGKVFLQQEDVVVRADSIEYARETEESNAWGSVWVEQLSDSTSTQIVTDRLYRNAVTDSIEVIGRTQLVRIDLAESDTVYVAAKRIVLKEETDMDTVSASDSVVVASSSYALRGDSLRTVSLAEGKQRSQVFGNPLAWLEKTQVMADSLHFLSYKNAADSLEGRGNVFVITEDSSSGRFQQLKGRSLTSIIENDSLKTLIIADNAEAIFYLQPEGEEDEKGVKASGDGMRMDFEDGEVSYVGFYTGVQSLLYSGSLMSQLTNLSGFNWQPELMPDRKYLMERFWVEVEHRRLLQEE